MAKKRLREGGTGHLPIASTASFSISPYRPKGPPLKKGLPTNRQQQEADSLTRRRRYVMQAS